MRLFKLALNFGGSLFGQSNEYDDAGNLKVTNNINQIERALAVDQAAGTNYGVYLLYDYDVTSGIGTGAIDGDWLRLDLGSIKSGFLSVNYHVIKLNAGISSVTGTLQLSSDGTTWADVSTYNYNAAGLIDTEINFTDLSATCRYIRILYNEAGGSNGSASFREVRFYI